jgi:hypothetical protein
VKAPSRYVEEFRGQVGGYSWGDRDVSEWAAAMARGVGMTPLVQPGLGRKTIVRAKPDGGKPENSWDVLANMAKETGCWLFEYGATLVFARPSWLVRTTWARRYWPVYFDSWSSYSEGLDGMPEYTLDPNTNPAESLTMGLLSPDADMARPGDEVDLGGAAVGTAFGKWVVKSVAFPMTVAAPVKITCVRPVDPDIPPPKQTKGNAAAGSSTVSAGLGGLSAAGSAAVTQWEKGVIGRAIDMDGAFGAQCVDLVQHYSTYCVGVPLARGNGKDIWFNENSGNYVKLGAGAKGQKGDIVCWDGSWGGGYGHVAVLLDDNGLSLNTVTQNPGPPREQVFGKNGLIGFLRPKTFKGPPTNTGASRWQ